LCLERPEPEHIKAAFATQGADELASVEEALRVINAKVPPCGEYVGEVTMEALPDQPSDDHTDAFDPPDSKLGQCNNLDQSAGLGHAHRR